jgi:hypothetical protein
MSKQSTNGLVSIVWASEELDCNNLSIYIIFNSTVSFEVTVNSWIIWFYACLCELANIQPDRRRSGRLRRLAQRKHANSHQFAAINNPQICCCMHSWRLTVIGYIGYESNDSLPQFGPNHDLDSMRNTTNNCLGLPEKPRSLKPPSVINDKWFIVCRWPVSAAPFWNRRFNSLHIGLGVALLTNMTSIANADTARKDEQSDDATTTNKLYRLRAIN